MTRDMDLVRNILLEIEKNYQGQEITAFNIKGYDYNMIAYHCEIMYDAGLISSFNAERVWGGATAFFSVGGLTWAGHDYLDKIRDDTIWGKTKKTIKDKGLPLIFDTIKTIASAFITAAAEGVANSVIKNGGVVE